MSKKCSHLLDDCRKCGRFFRRDERYLNCPECGEPRKCGAHAIRGYDRCRLHGGKPNLKAKYDPNRGMAITTGKHSKSLVANLASKYIEMGKSGPLVSNRKVLSVLDDRITELLDRIEENYSEKRIRTIVSAWSNLKEAFPNMKMWLKDNKDGAKAYATLDVETEKAYHDYESWAQIGNFMNLRAKVSKDEMSILKDMRALITAEDAYDLAAKLLAAVVKVLGDEPNGQKLIKAIHGEFGRILGEPYVDQARGGEQEIIDIDPGGLD